MGRGRTIAALAIAAVLCAAGCDSAMAQGTMNDALTRRLQAGEGKDRLLLEAKEIVYDNDNNTVSAVGDVELYYQGRTLQADRVTYDRKSGRVFAQGNARMVDASGAVITSDRFDLTEDFKNGFIDSLRVEQTVIQRGRPSRTYFTAPRAERIEGEQMVFERGTYTACEPCREHPERPPLWQVKAARIIHNNEERMIYYENATLELYGQPIAYLPYFWSPDPTVKRKTGFLTPHYIASSSLGTGVALPFFWNVAPNMDLTLQPTFLSRQGVLGQAEWRHRLLTGAYNIRAAGIFQQDETAFLNPPLGAQDREFRGSIETTGRFNINEKWHWGWDIALLSDKWFLANYRIKSESVQTLYLKESISTLYLQGQGDRSWFDARGYYFRGLSSYDWQKQLPVVHPVIDYQKRVDGPRPLGGETTFDLNLTSLSRDAAHFSQIPNINFGLFSAVPAYNGYYETCTVFQRGACIIRGLAGSFTRLSTQLTWRRNYVDDIGQVWTPFAYVRADAFWNRFDTTNFLNPQIPNFLGADDDFVGRVMPAIGLEYRYPFVAQNDWGMHVVEPIGQIVAQAEREPHRPPAERGRAEPRLRRHHDLQLGQVLGLRPRRGRRARQHRRPVQLHRPQRLLRQRARRPVLPARRPELIPPRRHHQCRPRLGARIARLRRRHAAADQAEPELRLLDPGPLRRERLRDAPARNPGVGELEPGAAAHDLADLRQIRPPARARLRPSPRGPSDLGVGQRHAALERRRLAPVRSRPLSDLPRQLLGGLHAVCVAGRRRDPGGRPGLSPPERLHADLDRAEPAIYRRVHDLRDQLLGEPARDRLEQRREGARPDPARPPRAAHARRGEREADHRPRDRGE
jgi:lipopolysaccharide assembly outer membrane protein LptD (OstA)